MPDYSKGKIYTIRCHSNNDHIYVGSTIQPLAVRWGGHKRDSKKYVNRLIYSTIGDNWADWYIELYLDYPCENKEQLLKKEGEIIREIGTLNKKVAGRTVVEYYQDNADKIREYQKEYRQENADKFRDYNKEYNQANVDKIRDYKKEYYQANADKIKEYHQANADKFRDYKKEYYQANAEKIRDSQKKYNQANADEIREKQKEYRQDNTDKIREYQKEYRNKKKLENQIM